MRITARGQPADDHDPLMRLLRGLLHDTCVLEPMIRERSFEEAISLFGPPSTSGLRRFPTNSYIERGMPRVLTQYPFLPAFLMLLRDPPDAYAELRRFSGVTVDLTAEGGNILATIVLEYQPSLALRRTWIRRSDIDRGTRASVFTVRFTCMTTPHAN